jgi:recombination protein RecR
VAYRIQALDQLISELAQLPGLGEKSAQRIAFHILRSKLDIPERLSRALLEVKSSVHDCPRCFLLTDQDVCAVCEDDSRSKGILCVVEDSADVWRIEETGLTKYKFHVLQGVLSPLDGVGPDQIRLKELLNRLSTEAIEEVVLALDADIEGDATCVYLTKFIRERNIKVTRIAHGVPIGGNLDFVDARTLGRALENRIELK